MQSGLTSSLMETSEDEEAKRKEAEKAAKKAKRGLTESELDAEVNIELSETNTTTLLHMPGILVQADTPEYNLVMENNKKYEELMKQKVGSDSYNDRGSQTLNLTLKTKPVQQKGFTQEHKEQQSTKWDIADSTMERRKTDAERSEIDYKSQIDKTMNEQLKHPHCLIDAEALASHVSIRSLDNTATGAAKAAGGANKSGTNSSKSGGKSTS